MNGQQRRKIMVNALFSHLEIGAVCVEVEQAREGGRVSAPHSSAHPRANT
jgi:hypothetical protein